MGANAKNREEGYIMKLSLTSVLVKCSWFDEVPFFRLKGVTHKGFEIITRVYNWRINKSSESFSALLGVL
jgi:hypothetical protein